MLTRLGPRLEVMAASSIYSCSAPGKKINFLAVRPATLNSDFLQPNTGTWQLLEKGKTDSSILILLLTNYS